jgi:hypothetical protein
MTFKQLNVASTLEPIRRAASNGQAVNSSAGNDSRNCREGQEIRAERYGPRRSRDVETQSPDGTSPQARHCGSGAALHEKVFSASFHKATARLIVTL